MNYTISADQPWLSCFPSSGTSTGEKDVITINFSTASLSAGKYSATITITDSASSNGQQTLTVKLTVSKPKGK